MGLKKVLFIVSAFFCYQVTGFSSHTFQKIIGNKYFQDIALRVDTSIYYASQNLLPYQNDHFFFFKALSSQEICEITLYPEAGYKSKKIHFAPSQDFVVIDSLTLMEDRFFRGKIKFFDLENTRKPVIQFQVSSENDSKELYSLKLAPFFETNINNDDQVEYELFQEEEKVIELPSTNVYNIHATGEWIEGDEFDYKLAPAINALRISIRPHMLGSKTFTVNLKTNKPFLDEHNKITKELPPISIKFFTKPNKLDYLYPDKYMVYFNADFKSGSEIQFDYNRNLILRKTYRIEDQQESGGNLIAELYTQSQVGNNNKIICRLRTFALHRINEGYLYIKDGDRTRFLSNFNIIEKPRIDEITIMHDGEDWTNNLNVFPGERLDVRVRGTGLQQSLLQFDGSEYAYRDTTRLSDEVAFYTVKVPMNISKKKLNIFLNRISTQYSLYVREYQLPTDFDFVKVNYGDNDLPLTNPHFNKPLFYGHTIKDISISFDPNKIDENGKLNGKQYISIEVKILNAKNDLIEIQKIDNIAVCPGENSTRANYYDIKDCRLTNINVNDYLVHKTYDLDPFTQIFITVTHQESKYNSNGYSRKIKLILFRKVDFDIDVSFPTGLITKQFNSDGISSLSGISIAAIAQFKFPKENQLKRYKPYTIGAGFIAINAFNLSQGASRDLGMVVLGTVTPVLNNSKLSFPLYFGGGYLLQSQAWFVLVGPGLRISF